MKRMISVFLVAMAMALFFLAPTSAAELYPRLDGNDVLVPDELIQTVEGEKAYAASPWNNWLLRGKNAIPARVLEKSEMISETDTDGNVWWRAKGMRGKRFHPIKFNEAGRPQWAKIEDVYDFSEELEFVDFSGSGPCLLVK